MIAPADLFKLAGLTHAGLFEGLELVWQALDRIKEFTAAQVAAAGANCADLCRNGTVMPGTVVLYDQKVYEDGFKILGGDVSKGQHRVELRGEVVSRATVIYQGAVLMSPEVHLAPGSVVEPGALIKGPSYIGPCSEVRQGAYLRGGCLVGAGCVVGHATEMKNAAMLDGAKAGHFAYLGDSILGREVNLGAGTKLANLKILDRPYHLKVGGVKHVIERRKFGAIMGDDCQTGCNSVSNPGVVMGPRCLAVACSSIASGYYRPRSVIR